MSGSIPRRHHYIPQYYLKGFCSSNSDQIWVYDKSNNEVVPFKTSTINAAVEKDFYKLGLSDTVEDTTFAEQYFANEVEGPVNPIIKEVLVRKYVGSKGKQLLSFYLFSMIGRVPKAKEWAKKTAPKQAARIRKAAYKKIDSDFSDGTVEQKIFLRSLTDQIIQKKVKNPSNLHLLPFQGTEITNIMMQMNWYFIYPSDSHFLTCDNPVFLHKSKGLSHGEFTFPIGKKIALWATSRKIYQHDLSYQKAHPRMVKEMNRRTIQNATRFVFSSHDEPWIAGIISKRDVQIRDNLDR